MAHQEDNTLIEAALEALKEEGLEVMGKAIRILLNEAMKHERASFLRAEPHERSEARRGYGNGYKPKTVQSRIGALELQIPQVRDLVAGTERFYPNALERGLRSERALKLAIAEMYVQGVSTRKVAAITQELCGADVSSTSVSRAAKLLDKELSSWRSRPLGETPYLVLDARYEKVRHGGSVIDCAVLIAKGVRRDGKRSILGVSVSLSEAEVHWREFLESLLKRGLRGVRMITSDDHAGLGAARRATLSGVPWQRCQFHLQQNAGAYVPKQSMRESVARDIKSIFTASDRTHADQRLREIVGKYKKSAPQLSEWLENALVEGLTVFNLPAGHRRMLRTTNGLERLNREIKRRTRVASLFPNEESLLRLVTAVIAEVSEEWETGRIYINLEIGAA